MALDRVSAEERNHDLKQTYLNEEYERAYEKALKLLNTGWFDSDTVTRALEQDAHWWKVFQEMLVNDPCAAGIKLRCALHEQLIKECLE